jgi:hypothetical protein
LRHSLASKALFLFLRELLKRCCAWHQFPTSNGSRTRAWVIIDGRLEGEQERYQAKRSPSRIMPKAKNRQRPLLRLRLDPDTLARLARGEPVFFDSLEGLDADVVLVYITQVSRKKQPAPDPAEV